ncbi:MAG: hypothetical protein V3R85_05065 [Alphaproteobacteria bacterium]
MTNRATLLWMLLAIGAGLSLFVLKYEVHEMEERLETIHHQTVQDLESLHVLRAEWSYLNQPARLEALARRLLALRPVEATQSVSIRDVPLRPVTPPTTTPRTGDGPPPLLATLRQAP